jgi:uncharacterized repeat protein (TIGR04076 family)
MAKCKITVLKRTVHQDLIDEYLREGIAEQMGPCDRFEDDQEFTLDESLAPPEGFCAWAWADIRSSVLAIMFGSNLPWAKPGVNITCCTDGCRPVVFKVERVD